MTRYTPNTLTLENRFPNISDEDIRALRRILASWIKDESSSRAMLEDANRLLFGYGVEPIRRRGRIMGYYVNTGSHFSDTLILDMPKHTVWAMSLNEWKKKRGIHDATYT